MEGLLAAMAAAVDTANESFSNSGSSLRGNSIDKGHGTTNDAVLVVSGRGDEEHTPTSNWAKNTSSSSNVVLPDRMEEGS